MQNFFVENIYYLGPDGSNAHNAMLKYIQTNNITANNFIPKNSIKSAFEEIKKNPSDICVLPIENSIEGIVRETIDNLLRLNDTEIKIQGEIVMPIRHLLLSKGNNPAEIKKIMSHPQALAQCNGFIHNNFPEAEQKEVSSTSYAALKVATLNETTVAAIANETCADLFGLNILAKDINDEKDNKTRFYILSKTGLIKQGEGKTAIILSTKNISGALCEVLKIFQKHKINLSYIDSRPSKRSLGEYLFFMEFDGYENEEKTKTALKELNSVVNFAKVLGSFPKFKEKTF